MCNNIIVSYTDNNIYEFTSPTNCTPNTSIPNAQYGINIVPYNLDGPMSIINNPTITTPTAIWAGSGSIYPRNLGTQYSCPAITSYTPNYADVSLIEVIGGTDYYAYVTFTNSNNDLYVYAWDFVLNTFVPLGTSFLNNSSNFNPRIEALKNTNYNTNALYADYMVVDDYLSPHFVQAYSNLWPTPSLSGWVPTNPDYFPVITGNVNPVPLGVGMYNTGYYHDYSGVGLNLTKDVDANTGLPASSLYYITNSVPISPGNSYYTSLSSTCNNDAIAMPTTPSYLLSCWTNFPSNMMYYKIASSLSLWKHNVSSVQGVNLGQQWEIGPNPANDNVQLYKPLGNLKNCSYKLYNLLGVEILHNSILGNSEKIELGNLPSGVYIIKIYEDGIITKSDKLVKE